MAILEVTFLLLILSNFVFIHAWITTEIKFCFLILNNVLQNVIL